MNLLGFDGARLTARQRVAATSLKPLADSLAADLEPLIARDIYVPEEKALLSRAGGRCDRDGALLTFDPFSPHEHRCPECRTVYRGDFHDRWWIYPYQLWLAERAVHSAVLHALRGRERHRRLAHDILARYADAYLRYPNRDNVLGPTRLFFSTYLESIWLLNICVATDILETAGDRSLADDVRERIVTPSRALIAQYDEGASNRQVWNKAAMMAASLLLDRREDAEGIVHGHGGLEAHLAQCLLADATWYEGDNYHLFAHRGLAYGVALAEGAGISIDPALLRKFERGFTTPFSAALPDFTFPSRKDSQYAVSLRQWRTAEWCELGLARTSDPVLLGALARMYDTGAPPGDTGRARSTADVERNEAPVRLTRASLNWRALLFAHAELPPLERRATRSAHFVGQGFTAFRREAGDVYVGVDWGQSGGGHGHPDRLNVIFAHGATRWLDDLGTGSYVDPSLHWYRSTLAHNAPFAGGHSQWRVNGTLRACDERGGFGWILAEAEIAPGVRVSRAIVVTPDYFVDELRWTIDPAVAAPRLELPIHLDGALSGATLSAAVLDGGDGLEDGFEFARDVTAADVGAHQVITLDAHHNSRRVRAWMCSDAAARWFRATAPGQPTLSDRPFYLIRSGARTGAHRAVWAWSPRITEVAFHDDQISVTLNNERQVHRLKPEYWQIELSVGEAHSGIELTGWQAVPETAPPAADALRRTAVPLRRGRPFVAELGAQQYRRSEPSWEEAGAPTARVEIAVDGGEVEVDVLVRTPHIVFSEAGATNPYDNEHPDINVHGIQVLLVTNDGGGAWTVLPDETQSAARVRAIGVGNGPAPRDAAWERRPDGFLITVRCNVPKDGRFAIAAIVNDAERGRMRRRGQLVFGVHQTAGEFVYLRGDRFDGVTPVEFAVRD